MSNPFDHEPRLKLSPQDRARLFALADGKCASCGRKIRPGERWDADHKLALERGGTNDDDNLQVLCPFCHKPKTADDHAEAGRMRRSYTRHVVPREHRKGRGWR